MKTAFIKVTILALISIAFLGCSGGSKMKQGNTTAPIVPPPPVDDEVDPPAGTLTTWPYSTTGETVTFTPASWEELNTYVGIRPLNDPSNVKINIHFKQVPGTAFYHGKVQLGYTDNGQFYFGSFTVGDGKNVVCDNCYNNGEYEAAPNFWSTIGGKRTFMAYVQDSLGSLIIVMEDDLNSGDGQGNSILRGRVYYRNFAAQACPPAGSPTPGTSCGQSAKRKCWYIYGGPHACYSNNMSQKLSSTDFSDGTYRLLGSFSGVRSHIAFAQ